MESIVIAVVAAVGVIGSALIQWRSNVATNRAATLRESRDRDERQRQSIRDQHEREALRAAEREAASAASEYAQAEAWRDRRTNVYVRSSRVTHRVRDLFLQILTLADVVRLIEAEPQAHEFFGSSLAPVHQELSGQVRNDLDELSVLIRLYGSDDAALRFVQMTALMLRGANLAGVGVLDGPPSQKWTAQFEELFREFVLAEQMYFDAIRGDLGTR